MYAYIRLNSMEWTQMHNIYSLGAKNQQLSVCNNKNDYKKNHPSGWFYCFRANIKFCYNFSMVSVFVINPGDFILRSMKPTQENANPDPLP